MKFRSILIIIISKWIKLLLVPLITLNSSFSMLTLHKDPFGPFSSLTRPLTDHHDAATGSD